MHTYIHTYMHTNVHACIHTYIHDIHTCMHSYIHTYIHTRTHIHTYIHTKTTTYRRWEQSGGSELRGGFNDLLRPRSVLAGATTYIRWRFGHTCTFYIYISKGIYNPGGQNSIRFSNPRCYQWVVFYGMCEETDTHRW